MRRGARIGIPRGLLYYRYGGIWEEILRSCGFSVVLSPPTSEPVLGLGLSLSVSDLCLPVKAFLGHAAALRECVDALFVPRYISVEQTAYFCPKFIGLPDMVRAALRDAPQVIDPVMNVKKGGPKEFTRDLRRQLGLRGRDLSEQLRILAGPTRRSWTFGEGKLTVGVTGRSYLTLDSFLNKGVVRSLNAMDAKVFFHRPDLYSIERAMNDLPKWVYWTMGKEVVTSVAAMLANPEIDGIVNLVNASCGPDSFMVEMISRSLDLGGKPCMTLTVDEHTSSAGLETRIEALADMMTMRKTAAAREK